MIKIVCAILCYNNSKIIQKLINDIKSFNKINKIDLIFVDDFSKDNTKNIILSNNLKIIKHNTNLGYGAAVKSAFSYAIKNKKDFLIIFPGDYQRSLKDLELMIKLSKQKKFELISGSKFKKIQYLPKHRKFGNLFYSKLAKYLWKSELEDVLSGFKSYKIKKFKNIFKKLPNNYSFDIVLNQIISREKIICKEFDAEVKYNKETTKMKSFFHLGKKNILYIGINMFIITIYKFIELNLFKN
jgi:hypothetical protein